MMNSFRAWIELVDAGPMEPTPSQDRRPDLKWGGLSDKKIPKAMRPEPVTSGFPTYGGPPLPSIGKRPIVKTV